MIARFSMDVPIVWCRSGNTCAGGKKAAGRLLTTLRALLAEVRSRSISVVVVYKVDRVQKHFAETDCVAVRCAK
jgi:hypothetical protein